MQSLSRIGLAIALVFVFYAPGFPQGAEDPFYREWIEYQDGKISVAFDQTPIEVALNIIQAKTGLQIVIPPTKESRLLNLRLSKLPLEPAVRFLVASIGFKSFALMYNEKGHLERAVVLDARPESHGAAPDARVDAAAKPIEPLTAQERAQLQKELERWDELKQEERHRIEERLKTLPPSDEREELIKEYARQLLGIKD
ncbi:MAG TPA: hypothetical protein VEG60_30860 [Candidatus Binatia bacterium]|nr:hypothetical protein [Candidatus Binatia bacterium]